MYEFYLGDASEIREKEEKFLLTVKRLLPKWLNGIPDCELINMHRVIGDVASRAAESGRRLVMVETGVGASTLAMVYAALKYDGLGFTWDLNAEKASHIRSVCTETIGHVLEGDINAHWRVVGYDSTSPVAGLPVLADIVDHVDYFLHDGDHVWSTIVKELDAVVPLLAEGGVVAVDDAQYAYAHTNEFIVNIARRKLGLPDASFEDNRTGPFHEEVEHYLSERWQQVESVTGFYRENYRNDLFFAYYDVDTQVRAEIVSDQFLDQEHRFEAWHLTDRRA